MEKLATRGDLYEWLGGGRIAEIGVWKGDNAQTILERAGAFVLVLIDHWIKSDDPTNQEMNRHPTEFIEQQYTGVVKRFWHDHRVVVCRQDCMTMVHLFGRHVFDWVYIDASHSYEAVERDILYWASRVKRGGYVCGHDYHSERHPGVTKAVDKFAAMPSLELAAVTTKDYPASYALQVWC